MPAFGVLEFLLWVLRRRVRYSVTGHSMEPTLEAGDSVYVDPRAFQRDPPKEGDVVVAKHPFRRSILWVKRVRSVAPDGLLELIGDNLSESTDSRSQGRIPLSRVLGRVTSRWARSKRDVR